MHIYLIEADRDYLPGCRRIRHCTQKKFLREMEVNILLNKRVIDYRDHKVILEDGIEIATRTFIWVSGVTGVTIGNMNPSLIGRGGRIWGSMATVVRNRAVAEFSKVQMQGWLAWVM